MIMMEYYCNDCEEGDEFQGMCYLNLPRIAGKPIFCPVFEGKEKCNWKQM